MINLLDSRGSVVTILNSAKGVLVKQGCRRDAGEFRDRSREFVDTLNPVSEEILRKLAPENRIRSIMSRSDCLICQYSIDCGCCLN